VDNVLYQILIRGVYVGIKITGLDQLGRQLTDASNALSALDGEITSVRFNPGDPASVEAAIGQVEDAIDAKIAPYRGNAMVESIAAGMKEKYREQLLERAAEERSSREGKPTDMAETSATLTQIQNILTDLQSADYRNYDHRIKKLARALHAPDHLDDITRKLTEGIDFEKWLAAAHATQGGMMGSAVPPWPAEPEKELGIVALLIDYFAENPNTAVRFAHTFYYSGNRPNVDLHNMTRQMLVPFIRDYTSYVRSQTSADAPLPKQADVKPSEVLSLKPGIWGMSIDLKEAWRRAKRRWRGDKQ
jgi:hypothetical protein